MPLWHCARCHHEWEGMDRDSTCDWCFSIGYKIDEETPFDKLCKELLDPNYMDRLLDKMKGNE